MTRPSTVYVLGQPWRVEYEARGELAGDAAGKTDLPRQRLTVAETQGPHQERDTLLHEILHAVGLVIGHELDEHQVSAITPVLLDLLRENPDVVAYLCEDIQVAE